MATSGSPPEKAAVVPLYLGAFDLLKVEVNLHGLGILVRGQDAAAFRRSEVLRRHMFDTGNHDCWREFGFPRQSPPVGADNFACDFIPRSAIRAEPQQATAAVRPHFAIFTRRYW
jgi:hypothetical protein